ncbi:ABC transporter ATP-binding protein [Daeguia caeni]|uniref:ABC transporter ATP-binding protein n=1 Tax=Daeguia caeni TaxID=439612 RepID=A0ABV9H494_9HYPH
MSSEVALTVKGLAKRYYIYDKPHRRLLQMLLARTGRRFYREFVALQDISFTVPKGKVVGILGKNGAGKSTLLQIICGTLTPSDGTVEVRGRVAALLELGSGFNPEFTGIENIYLNGQILGLSRDEVDAKLADILAFADIGDFVYQPVKTYSSGMFARLAFSVAVNVEPDLLIVDEALSVGDAWFQHKSMARMRQLMESGCSVLFVSHSIDAVRALCDEAIWLEQGRVKMHGNVTDVTNAYMNDVFIEHNRIVLQSMKQVVAAEESTSLPTTTQQDVPEHDHRSEKAEQPISADLVDGTVVSVRSKLLKNQQGQVTDHLHQGERFSLEFEIEIHRQINNLSLGFLIKDQFGQELTGESFFNTYRKSLNFEAGQTVRFVFSSTMLLRGGQSYSVALRINQVSQWDRSDNVIIFADELAMVFDVLADTDNPMWFMFKMPFGVACK